MLNTLRSLTETPSRKRRFLAGGTFVILAVSIAGVVSLQTGAQNARLAPLAVEGPASPVPSVRYAGWPTRDTSKFNSLTRMVSPPAPGAPRKFGKELIGDPAAGQKLVADRSRGGSCLACHVMGPAGGADLPGNVGPDLSEIGNAGRDEAEMGGPAEQGARGGGIRHAPRQGDNGPELVDAERREYGAVDLSALSSQWRADCGRYGGRRSKGRLSARRSIEHAQDRRL